MSSATPAPAPEGRAGRPARRGTARGPGFAWRVRHALSTGWIWVLWVAAAVLAVFLYDGMGGSRHAPGVAEVKLISVGSPRAARVANVLVRAGQAVEAGEVLARLDTSVLDVEIAAAEVEVGRLRAEIQKESVLLAADQLDQSRRLSSDARDSAQQLMQARTGRAQADAELAALEAEIGRHAGLVEQQLAPAGPLEELRRQQAVVRAQRQGQAQLVGLLARSSGDSLRRLQSWTTLGVTAPGAPPAASGPPQSGTQPAAPDAPRRSPERDVRLRSVDGRGPGAEPPPRSPSRIELLLTPAVRAVEVAQRRLEALRMERSSFFELRAPARGRVASVLLPPGSVAGPAVPVITLVQASSALRVVAYLTEDQAQHVHVGHQARLTPKGLPGPEFMAQVEALAPAISEMPVRFRRVFKHPAWCREAFLRVQGEREPGAVLPGQAYDVRFLKQGGAAPTPAGADPPHGGAQAPDAPGATAPAASTPGMETGPAGVSRLTVPPALARRTRIEPSGLLWIPGWQRYLVVSDDTGTKERDDHAAWVLSLDAAGAFDPTPVLLEGLPEVNDLEAVARCGDGIYLLSSQSSSRRGRRPLARQLLVRAQATPGPTLRAEGAVPLLQAITRAAAGEGGGAWLSSLGLPADPATLQRAPSGPDVPQVLDIEGLACVDGALLVGLKEPLDATGAALLWRLQRPGELVTSGTLTRAQLAPFGRVRLPEPITGAEHAMGIAGLMESPSGGLLVTSTLSAPVGGVMVGALWSLPALPADPAAETPVRLLQVFPGLKPEGVAVAPGGATVIVFDRGSQPPLWWQGRP